MHEKTPAINVLYYLAFKVFDCWCYTVTLVIALVAATFSQGHAVWPGGSLNNDKKNQNRSIWLVIM